LDTEVRLGRFREDLLYRLKTVAIHLPPLRERREDIQTLVAALLVKIAASLHKPLPVVSAEAMTLLLSYDWPGNVRELENVLTQAAIRARTPIITVAHLAALSVTVEVGGSHAAVEMLLSLEEVEARHIRHVLTATQFHKGRACQILGISRPALDRKISKFGLGSEREGMGS
jgi:two-component system response regulator AtoC